MTVTEVVRIEDVVRISDVDTVSSLSTEDGCWVVLICHIVDEDNSVYVTNTVSQTPPITTEHNVAYAVHSYFFASHYATHRYEA